MAPKPGRKLRKIPIGPGVKMFFIYVVVSNVENLFTFASPIAHFNHALVTV